MPSSQRVKRSSRAADAASGVFEYRVVPDFIPRVYVYDHCPFCVRARMILGVKNIRHDLIVIANDDFETPMQLIGKKAVPILQYCSAKTQKHKTTNPQPAQSRWYDQEGFLTLAESLDIVEEIDSDETLGAGAPILRCYTTGGREDLIRWKNSVAMMNRRLLYPRIAGSTTLGEFAFRRCREMFISRHPLSSPPTDYEANFKMTQDLLPEINAALVKLEQLIYSKEGISKGSNPDGAFSIDDIDLWPTLRNLTLVKGLVWPRKVREYVDHMAYICDIPLYDRLAF